MFFIDFLFSKDSNIDFIYKDVKFNVDDFSKGHLSFHKEKKIKIKPEYIEKIEEKNNFFQIWLNDNFFHMLSNKEILSNEAHVFFKDKKIGIEYCSGNPTGKMHIGNTRNLVIGNFIYKLLIYFGTNITSQFYINDMGNQIDSLLNSNDFEYMESKKMIKRFNLSNKRDILDLMVSLIKKQIEDCEVVMNEYVYESYIFSLFNKEKDLLNEFNKLLEPFVEEKDGRKVFKIEKNGIVEKHLYKKDGSPTYFLIDLMFLFTKHKKFDVNILVVGSCHNLHISIIKKFAIANNIKLLVKEYEFIFFIKDGKIENLSKRNNNVILYEELSIEMKKNLIFNILKNNSSTKFNFSFDIKNNLEIENFFSIFEYEEEKIKRIERKINELEKKLLLSFCCLEQSLNFFPFTLESSHIIRSIEKISFFNNKCSCLLSDVIASGVIKNMKKISYFSKFIIIKM